MHTTAGSYLRVATASIVLNVLLTEIVRLAVHSDNNPESSSSNNREIFNIFKSIRYDCNPTNDT